MTSPTKLFVSYSHEDSEWLKRLQVHFKALERDKIIDLWTDDKIQAGNHWDDEIKKAMAGAKIGILMLTADFIASDYISAEEQNRLLAREKNGELLVLVVNVGYCTIPDTLSKFHAINGPEKPLEAMSPFEVNRVFVNLVDRVKKALPAKIDKKPSASAQKSSQGKTPGRLIKLSYSQKGTSEEAPQMRDFEQQEIVIGRSSKYDLQLVEPLKSVSNRHVKLSCKGEKVYVTDLDSTNGTYLNDAKDALVPLNDKEISHGDFIKIGEFKICIDIPAIPLEPDNTSNWNESSADETVFSAASVNPYETDVKELVEVLNRIADQYASESTRRNKQALDQALHTTLEPNNYDAYDVIAKILLKSTRKAD